MLSVQHNMLAMNANRQLNINQMNKARSTERLSSGYRINRAADDAAGLAISEKMRSMIRGLNQSLNNIQNGIGLCNVADGALNEVHDMLHRMRELAVQGANGTYTDEDRAMLDDEMSQLKEEIVRIGEDTEYNTMQVFTPDEEVITTTTTLENPTAESAFFKLLGSDVSTTCYMQEALTPDMVTDSTSTLGTGNPYVSVHIDFKNIINATDNKIQQLAGTGFYVNCCTDCCPGRVTFADEVVFQSNGDEVTWGIKKADGTYYTDPAEFCAAIVASGTDSHHVEFGYKDSVLYIYDIDNDAWSQAQKEDAYFCDKPDSTVVVNEVVGKPGIWIQMSHRAYDYLQMTFGELTLESLTIENVNCLTQEACEESITSIKNAIQILSAQRSNIGAYSNRLEHAYAINANITENMQNAESGIRDADMAYELTVDAKYNILMQTSQAMLAQANQSMNHIVQLLQA